VSSVQLAFARIKESWEDAAFVSTHGRGPEEILDALSRSRKVAVLTDERWNPGAVVKFLLDRGVSGVRAYLCENLGTEGERVEEMSLSELSSMEEFAPLSLLLLLREREPERAFGVPEGEFAHRRGLITKQEIRAIVLSKLRLSERSILWDIGAGSGSISIEASFLARKGRIFAVERDPEQIRLLKENVRRFEAWNVEVIRAEAPEGLSELPDPDAVFIGGSGGRMEEILDAVCRKLKSGGRIVINAATLESVNAAACSLKRRGFETEVALINVARSKAVADLTLFNALNPVFVITAKIPEEKVE
ncbi:MAG: precorrin-6Y C5,15-methyltransferase (decarboxylating) subunit CbiT, partial [Deltaproteobacteria bacterium]